MLGEVVHGCNGDTVASVTCTPHTRTLGAVDLAA